MDDQSLTTKGDLKGLEKRMDERISHGFKMAREDSTRILNVLINVEKSLKGKVENHEERIVVLETAMASISD